MLDFKQPNTIAICSEGKWRLASDEVSIVDNTVYLQTNCASWIKIEWDVNFSGNSLVLGDAWERSYADLRWKPIVEPAFHPWYFSVKDGDVTTCIGVKTGPSALCSWTATTATVAVLMDVRCGCVDTQFDGRKLKVAELVSLSKTGDSFDIIHEFCKMMCDKPALPTAPFYGGDDWYDCYGNSSFDKILDHVKILSECSQGLKNRPYQTIDAGWQPCHNWFSCDEYIGGPFNGCNVNFKDMKLLADEIRALDVHPGIWFKPLETLEYIPEEATLRREFKNRKFMDPSHPLIKEKNIEDVERLVGWGYELIKHDFACVDTFGHYGPSMKQSVVEGKWSFYEKNKTTAEITLEYYKRTAKAAKGALIIACNTFSHLSAGIFNIYRTGDDTSGYDYKRTVTMGVNTLAFRGVQHNALYAADPDCVPITSKLTPEQIEQWMNLVKYSGTSMAVSVENKCYTTQVRDALTEAFALASEPHEIAKPLDWTETHLPTRWQTFDGEKQFDWTY